MTEVPTRKMEFVVLSVLSVIVFLSIGLALLIGRSEKTRKTLLGAMIRRNSQFDWRRGLGILAYRPVSADRPFSGTAWSFLGWKTRG
jgi:hypothetical protein